jgi:hypothetical protein
MTRRPRTVAALRLRLIVAAALTTPLLLAWRG